MRLRTHFRWRRQSGQSLPETVITLPLILFVVFWIFELGWLMHTYSVMADAANEGVRYAIVHTGGGVGSVPTTQTVVKDFAGASLHNIKAISTSVTFPDGDATPPNRVRVTVTYVYIPYLPKFIFTPTMHTFAEGRMVGTAP